MVHRTSDWLSLWTAPFELARTAVAFAETAAHSQSVIAARMPIIASAMASPWTADGHELGLMVSEKVAAAGRSARSRSGARLRSALGGQTRALEAPWIGPAAWFDIAERNVAIAAALVALPGEMLKPFHTTVTANAQRLKKRPT
ncbi:hypothetical protein HZF05_14815 [Sphingomonas sp. CGMCC 1.13654]|uniref:Uncharacterized protein n=1 Tax=Sphingomonas chungangi TaxID=2683589 RepID=A0A838LB40_9SPHN|nr:hypothetical protein [Sphingomonas chungangi]MBA2935356.1 hypothetical protein [Sphingomonas chungangi]MVW56862.1 hypothetical protein [Sphingomonas chungangi]